MRERRLAIVACARLATELEHVARGFDPAEVVFLSYPARCGRPPLAWDELVRLIPEALEVDRVELFAGCCLERLGEPSGAPVFRVTRLAHCLSPLAGDFAVARYQEQGLYLVTSGWLGQWRERLAEQGLAGETAAELFGESVAGILHLDTGVLPEADRELSAFASQLRLPHQTVLLGLDQLALRCERLVLTWRAERRETAAGERLELVRRRNADYAMVLDLLKLIVQTTGKETVLGEILQLYQMMFAAGEVAWVPIGDGAAGEVVRTGPGDPAQDNRLKAAALALEAPSQLLPSGAGFLLRVEWEGQALGVICVDRIALPDHLEQYLQVARETVVVCAVVLNNALNLENLIALSHRLMLNEEALRESEQIYHDLFQKSSAVQLLIDPGTGEILDANEAAAAFYGYPPGALTEKRIDQLNDLPQPRIKEELARALGGEDHFLFRHRLASGELRNVEIYSTAIRVGGRTLLHTIIHDITERVRSEEARRDLEKRLQLAHKAQSLGRMAAAIAHKYNNLLGAVLGNLELALLSIPPGKPPAENLGEALKAASRAAEVSTLMLTYLGQAPGRHEKLDLAELCRHSTAALQNGLPPGVALVVEMDGAPAWVSGNEQQLQQLLASLVTNGWEALAGGTGEVRLSLKSVDAAQIGTANRFPLDWEPEEGIRFCALEIVDQGCGISDADIGELFDPFFSKKFTGRGLGLAIVLGVVRTHHGAVTVESEPGKGSTFRVYLPQLEYAPHPKSAGEQPQALSGGTVLLVEDEPAVRKTTSAMLGVSGFAVLEARDGAEALELYRQNPGAICLVVSDLTMPGLDGWSTLAALRNLDPDLPAILTSGYDQSQVMCGDHLQWPQVFLRKPYTMGTLREAIRQALAHLVR
ncbi:hypothetical protein GMST_13260 [Geomonas silvestris]|uniref:histidine kinase n=1 Tax=Geomonas silvestris TaxID=2740184 RepID=A0A6V8MG80_9BACT|nr:ATP-binding protein [Geomonas silvestris]GFO59001.1 hypothetical protein GMST_13260 [Geomonas silvestris]